ncbi:MAG: RAMP superfamily CRISPR-associated protein [Candidatus Bathyarchaeia archaeon]|nr:hypothetical protein [Candidatus Bathyarchaeota archaeon]
MSKKYILVKVEGKKKPTDRSILHENKKNFKLNLQGEVESTSYLFSSSLIIELPSYFEVETEVKKAIDALLVEVDMEKFIGKVKNIIDVSKRQKAKVGQYRYTTGQYVIPGSAIKGSVRSRIEYKFKPFLIGPNYYSYSCYITQGKYVDERLAERHIKLWGEEVSFKRESCNANNVCILCDMFGNPNLASRTYFSDAVMSEGKILSF